MQRLWLANLAGQATARQIGAGPTSDSGPVYGPDGYVYFQAVESGSTFVCRMREDGTGREKLIRDPIIQFQSVSPDGQWVIAQAAVSGEDTSRGVLAYSLRDGSRLRVCHHLCFPQWKVDGSHFLITFTSMSAATLGERTFSIPLAAGQLFPALPRDGVRSRTTLCTLKVRRR